MGRTPEDSSFEWMMITSAIKRIARCSDSSYESAESFLLLILNPRWGGKPVRHRYRSPPEFDGRPFSMEYFFLRNRYVRVAIAPDDTVTRTGRSLVEARADPSKPLRKGWVRRELKVKRLTEEYYIFDPANRQTTARIFYVQVCWDDIADNLRAVGPAVAAGRAAQPELPLTVPAQLTAVTKPSPPQSPERLSPPNWIINEWKNDPPKPGESKNKWAKRKYPALQEYFGAECPWGDWESLRRRMNDPETKAETQAK
jgi:hypothetical protein